jgi:tetratricopeptide (TPR) repeat protein
MVRAEGLFEKALSLDPASPVVLNNFGVLMMKKKDFESAAKFFKKALKYDKRNAGIFQNLGLVSLEMQDLKDAVKYHLLALESSPGNVEVRRVLKDIYIRRGNLKKAVVVLSEIIALEPTDTESKITYGDLLIQLGEREQGVGVYEDVVKNNPGNNQYLIKLANAYKGIEWYDIAILKLEKILKESPKSPGLLGLLGEIYFLKARSSQRLTGDLGLKSLYYLKNAYKLAPGNPEIIYWYAKVLYECKSDTETALPLFKKCLDQPGLDPEIQQDIRAILKK